MKLNTVSDQFVDSSDYKFCLDKLNYIIVMQNTSTTTNNNNAEIIMLILSMW